MGTQYRLSEQIQHFATSGPLGDLMTMAQQSSEYSPTIVSLTIVNDSMVDATDLYAKAETPAVSTPASTKPTSLPLVKHEATDGGKETCPL
jgi:hypothetical protein